jgi:murein DD-endopeptidase MepM/ murein hydrolase activator NlpD
MNFPKNIKIALFSALLSACLFSPSVTHAGVFSYIADMFSGQEVSAESETFIESNSQNMPLLEAAITSDVSMKLASDITVVGEEALLPEVGPSTQAPETFDTSSGQISVYVVRSGDTFAGIAEMFDVSVNTILWANDMTRSSVLKVGQNLVILPMSGVSGDTLNTIAKKYSGDIDEIASFNEMKPTDKLVIGDTIMIPDGEVSFSTRPSVSSSGTSRLVTSSSGPDYSGYYQKPFLTGRRTQGLHGYNGVDYGMAIGTPLYASASGVVIISRSSGYNGGYGSYVAIQHNNGTQTIYAHMSSVLVSVGQKVNQGQLIGTSGNTGKSTGPHLHFEVRGAKNPF